MSRTHLGMHTIKWVRLFLHPLFLLVFISSLSGQSSIKVKGVVLDANDKTPVPYASVVIYEGEKLLDGVSTDNFGHFDITIEQEATHMEVSFIGYKKRTLLPDEWNPSVSLKILLTSSSEQLDEVVVSSERTLTQLAIDRKIINLGADLQQSGTTALEAFDQLTEIQTDLSTGSLSLRGSGNVRLLINGKPSAMTPSEVLAQIPASSIDQIEIITSPSARNQADGLSGIINIKLKKNRDRGLNLSANTGIGTKRHHFGMLGNLHLSKLNVRWNGSEANRRMNSKQSIRQRHINGNTRDFFAPHDFNGVVRKVGLGIDLFLNETNEFSLETDYTYDHHDFINYTFYSNVSNREDFIYLRNSSHTHKTSTVTTNYRKTFRGDQHYLELDYNFTRNNNLLPAEDFDDGQFLFEEEKSNRNTLQAFALDYFTPLNQKIELETGLAWNQRIINSSDLFEFRAQPNIEGAFSYDEDQIGIYALAKLNFGKAKLQTGIRFEQFNSNSINSGTGESTSMQFSNFFPSFHLSYAISDNQTLNLGYSKRVSRPNFSHVNPFRMGNQYFRWEGNASLRPEFSNNLEVNYQRNANKWSFSASSFFRYRTEVIERLQHIDMDGVQTIGFDNIGKKFSYGIEADFSYAVFPSWEVSAAGNYYRTNIKEQVFITWDQLFSSSVQLKNTLKVTKNISTDLMFRHTGKNQNAFDFRRSRNRLDWAVRARLFDNKLTVNARIIDVLNNNLMYRTTKTSDVRQKEVWKFQSQTFGYLISMEYKIFSKSDKLRNRKKRNYSHRGATD